MYSIDDYLKELILWNKKHNLISKNEILNLEHHVSDSLSLAPYIINTEYQCIIDIGSGGGFPICPLGFWIKENNLDLSLIATDVIDKKIAFLRWCSTKFSLPIDVIKVDPLFYSQNKYLIVSRAFSSIKNILSWREIHIPRSCDFLLLKGPSVQQEIEEAKIPHDLYELFPNDRGYIMKLHHPT